MVLLMAVPVAPVLVQGQTFTIEVANRADFLADEELEGSAVPVHIELKVGELPPDLEASALDGYMKVEFSAVKYKDKDKKLILKGMGRNETKLKYTFYLDERTGELKIDGYSGILFEAFGVWTCTNHENKHTCGKGQSDSLKDCSEKHGCVF